METGEFGQQQNFDELVPNSTPIVGGDSANVQRDAFGNPLSAGPEAMMSYDALLGGDIAADTQEGSTSAGGAGDTTVPSNRHIQPVYGDELITNIPPIDAAIDKIAWAHDTLAQKGGELAEDAVPMLQQLRTDVTDKVQDLKGKAADSWNSPTNQYRINFEEDINELKGIVDEVVQSDLVQRGLKSADQAVKSAFEKIKDVQFGSEILQRLFTPVAEGAIDLLSGAALEAKSGGGPTIPADAKEFQGQWYTWRSYQLQPGDTLSNLALEMLGDGSRPAYEFIAEHNGIQNPDKIYAGLTIELPFAVSYGKSQPNGSSNGQTTQSQASEWQTYTVKSGDTLSGIAAQFMGDSSAAAYNSIAEHNGITDPNRIYAGQVIEIPRSGKGTSSNAATPVSNVANESQSNASAWQTYVVQSGDTLSEIAGRFMGDSSAAAYNLIAEHNDITDPSKIFVGQVLEVPGSRGSNSSAGSSISSVRNSELAGLSSDDWDRLSGDNTRFDGAIWGGEKDERNLTPDAVKQVYDDLSTALFGQRYKMTAGYLYDQSYFNGRGTWHAGIDIDAPDGTAVKSLTSGTVAWVWEGGSRGDFIAIKGDDGREWVYGHLQDKGGFSTGQKVNAGQVIGQIGNQQDASHLHLEVRTGGGSTGGAHIDQDFVRDVTMSPLQAFYELQPEPKGSYEENFDARIYQDGADTLKSEPKMQGSYEQDFDARIYEEGSDFQASASEQLDSNQSGLESNSEKKRISENSYIQNSNETLYSYVVPDNKLEGVGNFFKGLVGVDTGERDTILVTSSAIFIDQIENNVSGNSLEVAIRAYNPHPIDALVEIYNEQGELVDIASTINANKFHESLLDASWDAFSGYFDGTLARGFTDIRNSTQATELDVTLQSGQRLDIAVNSEAAQLYNAIALVVDAIKYAPDLFEKVSPSLTSELMNQFNPLRLARTTKTLMAKEGLEIVRDTTINSIKESSDWRDFLSSEGFINLVSYIMNDVSWDMSKEMGKHVAEKLIDIGVNKLNPVLGKVQENLYFTTKGLNIVRRFDVMQKIAAGDIQSASFEIVE